MIDRLGGEAADKAQLIDHFGCLFKEHIHLQSRIADLHEFVLGLRDEDLRLRARHCGQSLLTAHRWRDLFAVPLF